VKYECRNLAPQQVTGEIFVEGIFFTDLQRGGRLAERVSGQSPFLKPHGYLVGPANTLSGNTRSDERKGLTGNLRIRQPLIIEGGVDAGRKRAAPDFHRFLVTSDLTVPNPSVLPRTPYIDGLRTPTAQEKAR
jgi:hypothetical protein